jgi:hypothetical protein
VLVNTHRKHKLMNKFNIFVALLVTTMLVTTSGPVHAAPAIYADGDLAPLGYPDGLINSADYLIANRIVLDSLTATDLGPGSVGTSEVVDNSLTAADLAVYVVSSVDRVVERGGEHPR